MGKLYRLELNPGWSWKISLSDLDDWRKQNNIDDDSVYVAGADSSGKTVMIFAREEDMTAFRLRFGL